MATNAVQAWKEALTQPLDVPKWRMLSPPASRCPIAKGTLTPSDRDLEHPESTFELEQRGHLLVFWPDTMRWSGHVQRAKNVIVRIGFVK